MGFLFALIGVAFFAGVGLFVVPQSRPFAGLALVPLLAGVTSLCASWGLAVGLEAAFSSGNAGGVGFFGGYVIGGLSGAAVGWVAAVRIMRRAAS